MDTDTLQPRPTKEWLIDDGLRVLIPDDRRLLARELLVSTAALPDKWLTRKQQAFRGLRREERPGASLHRTGTHLISQVAALCDLLIPALIEDYLRRHHLGPRACEHLRRNAPPTVCRTLIDNCPSWPPNTVDQLEFDVRHAVHLALGEQSRQAAPADDGPARMIRPDRRPVDQLDFVEKLIMLATGEESALEQSSRFLWGQEARYAFRVGVALVATGMIAVLFVALFIIMSHVESQLTVRDNLTVVGSAIGAALGGTGLGLLGQAVRARLGRGRHGDELPACPPSGGEDPVRPSTR
jgi:hypothetical protein